MPESPIQSFKAGSIVSKGYLILIPNKKWTAFAVYFPQYFVVVSSSLAVLADNGQA